MISRPHYETAVLSTLNERIKSGDVTLDGSRRWADFDDYLIPQAVWEAERLDHYAALGLPTDPGAFVAGLDRELKAVTAAVEARVAGNAALTINARRGRFKLARPRRGDGGEDDLSPRAAETPLGKLIRRRLPRADLADGYRQLGCRSALRHPVERGLGGRNDRTCLPRLRWLSFVG